MSLAVKIVELLANKELNHKQQQLIESKNQARQLISQGAVSVNGTKVSDTNLVVIIDEEGIIVKYGKLKQVRFKSKE